MSDELTMTIPGWVEELIEDIKTNPDPPETDAPFTLLTKRDEDKQPIAYVMPLTPDFPKDLHVYALKQILNMTKADECVSIMEGYGYRSEINNPKMTEEEITELCQQGVKNIPGSEEMLVISYERKGEKVFALRTFVIVERKLTEDLGWTYNSTEKCGRYQGLFT